MSRGGGANEVQVNSEPLITVDVDRVLGFEATTVSDWSIIQSGPGTLSTSTTASQGSRSLAVAAHGYVPVQSVVLTSLGSRVGSVIHFDIMLPSELKQVSPGFYGAAQLYLSIPSLGWNNAYLGQRELTSLPVGQWNTVTFTPSSDMLAKLRANYSDLRVTIVVNAPYNATKPYLLDNLRFSDNTLALVTVVDSSGHPISGLTVVAYNGSTPTNYSGVTDSTGVAKISLPPGSYRFGVTEAGVTTYSSPTSDCQVPGLCQAVRLTAKCHTVTCSAKDACHDAGTCDPGTGICSNPAKAAGTVCRAAAGPCDLAEVCDGSGSGCPADGFLVQGVVCRAAAGACDVQEVCSGASAACPADTFAPSSIVCRASAGPCDSAENCSGTSPDCPADVFASSTTVCRPSAGVCDAAETCTGTSPACPADVLANSTTVCRPSTGSCDPAETCSGASPNCPADVLANSSTVCRAKAGECDVAETCTGTSPACPADGFMANSSVCRPSAGICDPKETCTGTGPDCPADVLSPSNKLCRPSAAPCDAIEYCTGTSPNCPPDVLFAANTTICRPATGLCDPAELCTGTSPDCPADVRYPFWHVCGADGTRRCDWYGQCLTPCGPAAQPAPHEVMVFSDKDFGGQCLTLAVGDNLAHTYIPSLSAYYRVSVMGADLSFNDCISSLKVGSKARLHAFLDDNFSAMIQFGATDPARNAYLPNPDMIGSCFAFLGCMYDMGDNPIDTGGVIEQKGSIRYADQATYDPNAQPMNHNQLGPNVGDWLSSLIIDNLDVYGNGEPLASSYLGDYPGNGDGGFFWADGNQGLCHNHDYWFITQNQRDTRDWAAGASSCVDKIGRIWRCPLDCDLNTGVATIIPDPQTHAPIPTPGNCSSCISKSLYDYSVAWRAADPNDVDGSVFYEYNHFGDPDRATVNGTDYVLVPVQPCAHDANHPAYMLVLDVNLNYVGRWFIPDASPNNHGIDPGGYSAAWVAVRPGSNEIWTSYPDYLLNKVYGSSDPNDPSTWLSFYSTDDPDWSGNHFQNGLLVFDPEIWGHPRGTDPKAIQTLSFLYPPAITGLRGYPVSMKTAQGGVFSPSGKVLYLAAGYTGDESVGGEIGNGICYAFDWLTDCMQPSDYGVVTAIDADSGFVLETSGHGVGWFNYQIGSDFNTNEPEGLDFFDTACYAADHGGQPPPGFGLTQLHAMVNNDNLSPPSGVYLKHYTGQGQGSMCDSGFGSDVEMVQQALRANRGVGFCAGNLGTSGLACSDFEVTDQTDWLEPDGEEPSVWAIRSDTRRGLNSTILVQTANDNGSHDRTTCGAPASFPQDRTVSASVTFASSAASADQGAMVYGLYQDANNAYYAYLRTDGNIELGKRQNGDPMTIATATVAPPGTTWHALSLQLVSTTDTVHPPAGGLWAVVAFDGTTVIDQLADSAPGWTSACAGVGTFAIQAAFDDFLVTSP